LEALLEKAKEHEKKYEWLQASEDYQKAFDIALDEKSIPKAAEIQEKIGFSYYMAALQAKSNVEFKKILKQSISAYKRSSELLEGVNNEIYHIKIKHANALIAYLNSRYETDPKEIKRLSYKWWTLEKEVLRFYEDSGDLLSIGKTCNDLIEYSAFTMFWALTNFSDIKEIYEDSLNLSEKAIKIFLEIGDNYELARAYCSASWYYSFSSWYLEDDSKIIELSKKCKDYSERALELANKVGDTLLIGRAYHSAWSSAYFDYTNPASTVKYGNKMLECGLVTRDNFLLGHGYTLKAWTNSVLVRFMKDPDEQKQTYKNMIELSLKAQYHYRIIQHIAGFNLTYTHYSQAISNLAAMEPDSKRRQKLLKKAIKIIEEGLALFKGWIIYSGMLHFNLGNCYRLFSATQKEVEEKRKFLVQSKFYVQKALHIIEELIPYNYPFQSTIHSSLALSQIAFGKTEFDLSKKKKIIGSVISTLEKCIFLVEKRRRILKTKWAYGIYFGRYYYRLGLALEQAYNISNEKEKLVKGIDTYKKAIEYYIKAETPIYLAESYWHSAQLFNHLGDFSESSKNYEEAANCYVIASKRIPQFEEYYGNYSMYLNAWSQIEQARYHHSLEDYKEARDYYDKAVKLLESTVAWSYLAPNYLAWAYMEEAEDFSRRESAQQAKQTFQKAFEYFSNAEEAFKQKLETIISADEKEITQKLFQATGLRQKYCTARILLEEAKLLDREGRYLQSSKNYEKAAQNISEIVDKIDVETERKELEYSAILCRAWGRMAAAEETTSTESYLAAAELFEQAKEHCYTKKASLWALGNSNFCRGLAAGVQYQTNLDLEEHAKAKSFMKIASTNYAKAGFKAASEYARATQRLFDAYAFMNQAENELNQEKRAKQYQMAENLLQIASDSFTKAKQPEKTAQVQQMLKTVREEKALAASLNQVMHAPTITSSTISFTAPSPTREVSVGLESFEHANVQANLIVDIREVKVGESFRLSVEFVNAGKEPALLTRIEDFVSPDFIVVKKPEIFRLEDNCLNMKGKQIAPLKLVEAKLVLQPSKKGVYQLKPTVHYLNERGQEKSLQLKSVEIKVEEVILADRVSTGTRELDSLLLGGIPKEHAIILTGPASDERERIIKNFLEAGTKEEQTSFYVTTETDRLENILEKSGFHLFLCNPKPKGEVPDLPNVTKLRSKTDLTNLNIALLKAYRNVEHSSNKRVCINIVSDVLIDYGVKTTRKWIAELTTDLISKGFTVLAVINPEMHAPEQTGAVLDIFDGEISITQTGDPLECKKSIIVKKLRGQDYIKNPVCLTNLKY
jgi:KaiC/GvpD/RAD55 family RecA-like ATPase/tetratricopeptide (TPR) repeat protein